MKKTAKHVVFRFGVIHISIVFRRLLKMILLSVMVKRLRINIILRQGALGFV